MSYVDGFILAVANDKKDEYAEFAKIAGAAFKKHGALRLVECCGEDVPDGEVTSFPMAVKKQDTETVWFSWIEWPSKAVRDDAMPKIMAEESVKAMEDKIPFDGKRMIFGGFDKVVEI